jgi:hypothetical protein
VKRSSTSCTKPRNASSTCFIEITVNEQKALRDHLVELLDGGSAHIRLKDVLTDFPVERINDRPDNLPHSAWELLEHIRLAQWDILEFSQDAAHISPEFPEGYWPSREASADDWKHCVSQVKDDLQQMIDLVSDPSIDLFAPIPHGTGQTILREVLLVADHNAYHLGQLMLVKKMLTADSV